MHQDLLSNVRASQAALLLGMFAAAIAASTAIMLGLRELGWLPQPADLLDLDLNALKTTRELGIRLELALYLAACLAALLASPGLSGWFRAQRWRTLALRLFALGALSALLDPFHPITSEGNWIRYWTAGCLLLAGLLALGHSTQRELPGLDRVFGAGFGLLLLAAGSDELLQLHEQLGAALAGHSPLEGILDANDVLTLGIATIGLLVLGVLVGIRVHGGRIGRVLARRRYRLPLRQFAFAVVSFLIAMLLDSFDDRLQRGFESFSAQLLSAPLDPLWLALSDVGERANAVEELLEYAAAVALLMLIGSLFSIEQLGGRPANPARWQD
jgi:hypothetical protein